LPFVPKNWGIVFEVYDEGFHTGSIERFSAKENFRKILKASYFYLRFSPDKNTD